MTDTDHSAPVLAGNVPDPDANVIDSLVEQHAEPPAPADLPVAVSPARVRPLRTTRLLTGSQPIRAEWGPVLILPADDARENLQLVIFSGTATDHVLIADDPGKLQTGGQGFVLHPNVVLPLAGHTGPVWAVVPSAPAVAIVGPIDLAHAAVTL